jgi:hypothetical protein
MTIKEAINHYYNKPKDKKREIGHYHASEIWYIYKGYTNPTNFFKQKEVDKEGQANMFRGSAMEDMLVKVLTEEKVNFETQKRLEIEIAPGIFISGKTDFEFPECILETKRPKADSIGEQLQGIPDKWRFQMEIYHRATKKDVYLGIFYGIGDEIIRMYKYEPSDETWELIKSTLIEFNKKLINKSIKVKK